MPTSKQIADVAESMKGVRWLMHGRDPSTGLDCGGIVVASLRGCGIEPTDSTNYDARMPPPDLLWRLCRENGTEQPHADSGEGRLALCSWGDGIQPRHLAIMLSGQRIVHVHAGVRRVVVGPSSWIGGRLLAVFRLNHIEYGEPW